MVNVPDVRNNPPFCIDAILFEDNLGEAFALAASEPEPVLMIEPMAAADEVVAVA